MNKKGEGEGSGLSVGTIVIIILLVLVVFVAGASGGTFFGENTFPFLKGLPGFNNSQDGGNAPEILRYNLGDGSLEYFTGVDWKDGSENFDFNNKKFDGLKVKQEVESYYYGTGSYAQVFTDRGIRVLNSTEPGKKYFVVRPQVIFNSGDSRTIRNAKLYRVDRELAPFLKDGVPGSVKDNFGWVIGTFEMLGPENQGQDQYYEYYLLFSSDDELYFHKGTDSYEIGSSENQLELAGLIKDWRDGILKVPVKVPTENAGDIYVCPEFNSGYLVLRLKNEVGSNDSC